jgi:hypothetical protein
LTEYHTPTPLQQFDCRGKLSNILDTEKKI